MAKRYPTTRPPMPSNALATRQGPAPVRYVPEPPQVVLVSERALAAKRAEDQRLYNQWVKRQAAIREKDRKNRRFWFGFGAVLALGFLAALVVAGWLLWTAVGLGVLAVPVMVGLSIAGAVGGHRCITIVQHWH